MVDFHSLEKRLEVVLDVPVILFNGAMPDVSPVTGIEKYMANRPLLITTVILVQILVTLILVGSFS
jgi:hypothetical protein